MREIAPTLQKALSDKAIPINKKILIYRRYWDSSSASYKLESTPLDITSYISTLGKVKIKLDTDTSDKWETSTFNFTLNNAGNLFMPDNAAGLMPKHIFWGSKVIYQINSLDRTAKQDTFFDNVTKSFLTPTGAPVYGSDANGAYLSFDGTQYFDSGYIAKGTKTKIELAFQQSTLDHDMTMFGARIARQYDEFAFQYSTWWYFEYATCNRVAIAGKDLNRHTLTIDKNTCYIDGVAKRSFTLTDFQTPVALAIGAMNTNGTIGTPFSGKIWEVKIYEDNVLVHDFVPVPAGYNYNDAVNMFTGYIQTSPIFRDDGNTIDITVASEYWQS